MGTACTCRYHDDDQLLLLEVGVGATHRKSNFLMQTTNECELLKAPWSQLVSCCTLSEHASGAEPHPP